jgi:flavin reductase (DIM6/NTAB) family NADH-FMN oxidoreductase RutF
MSKASLSESDAMQPNLPDLGIAPSPETARDFRSALGSFATGVTLVTIAGPEGPMGFVANSFSSISIDPPLVLWAPAKSAHRFPHYAAAKHFAIHVLSADQGPLVNHFHRGSGSFEALDYSLNAEGVPLLAQALARFECRQSAVHEGGDHLIVVGEVLRFASQDGVPLIFVKGKFGHFAPQP